MSAETIIAGIFEKSIVAGAFVVMLYFILNKQERQVERQSVTLEAISDTLSHTSHTLIEVCRNMESMDRRLTKLEERGNV